MKADSELYSTQVPDSMSALLRFPISIQHLRNHRLYRLVISKCHEHPDVFLQ